MGERGVNIVGCELTIMFVENGKQVIAHLRVNNDRASLIVLDLNMPEMDGRQTLKYLKNDPSLKDIPVAIVTTSASKLDKDVCRKLGASVYLTKPDTHHEWQNIVRLLEPLCS
jgi:CheY-like chemotaxis protein